MADIQNLQIQLDNLHVLFEDEIVMGADIQKIKFLFIEIKKMEKLVAESKSTPLNVGLSQ